jgi:hypothetical protein
MPQAVAEAFNRPGEWQKEIAIASTVIQHNATAHHHQVTGVEPEEHFPGILRPLMCFCLFDETATVQRFVHDVDDVHRHHHPE